jgi:hypothetical protein
MASTVRPRKTRPRQDDTARRVGALIEGLSVARILRADDRELVIEFSDGTRLFVRGGAQALATDNANHGIFIDSATGLSRWGGERMDYDIAIETLLRRDRWLPTAALNA